MSLEFRLPDLGEGLTEATVVSWLVERGDHVDIDQPIVEVESAKSVVQLPCPYTGRVEHLGAEVGAVMHEGDVLVSIEDGDASGSARAERPSTRTDDDASASGAVLIGYGTRPVTVSTRTGRRFGRSTAAALTESAVAERTTKLDPSRRSPVVSPLVRRLARENGFDASHLIGSGADQLVLRRDVEGFIATHSMLADDTPAAGGTESTTPDRRESLSAHQRAAAEHFARSRREIPEATIWLDVDATPLLTARREIGRATGVVPSITAMFARIAVAGLLRHPVLNASFDAERSALVFHHQVNLGIAAQTPRGLRVPVVPDAHDLTLTTLGEKIDATLSAARDSLDGATPHRVGTFTLNNFGSLGVDGSAAIINHPEVAILGIGRIIDRPWVVDGQLAVRSVVELSFVFDHRVCDGQVAADFLTFVARCVENPVSLLADL